MGETKEGVFRNEKALSDNTGCVVLSITAVGYIMTFNKVTIIDGKK